MRLCRPKYMLLLALPLLIVLPYIFLAPSVKSDGRSQVHIQPASEQPSRVMPAKPMTSALHRRTPLLRQRVGPTALLSRPLLSRRLSLYPPLGTHPSPRCLTSASFVLSTACSYSLNPATA